MNRFGVETEKPLQGESSVWSGIAHAWNHYKDDPEAQKKVWAEFVPDISRNIQDAIEIVVTSDALTIDDVLVPGSSEQLGFNLQVSWGFKRKILRTIRTPTDVRERVVNQLNRFRATYADDRFEKSRLFHANDEKAHDYAFERSDLSDKFFANSNDHPICAAYYLGVAEEAGVPYFLSPTKRGFIEALLAAGAANRDPQQDVQNRIKEIVLECVESRGSISSNIGDGVAYIT